MDANSRWAKPSKNHNSALYLRLGLESELNLLLGLRSGLRLGLN